jgi:hypothetical protein
MALVATAIANDPAGLDPVALAVEVRLAKVNFSPGSQLIPANFTQADFDGYAKLDAVLGEAQIFFDPTSGLTQIQLNEPAGGWHWETTGLTFLPQTIYGFYVTTNGAAVLIGCALFTPSLPLTIVGQGIDIDQVRFTLVAGALI